MSLARLWQSNGKTAEPRQLLPGTYVWFTEEFDTLDLVDLKPLFEEFRLATNTTSQRFRWSLALLYPAKLIFYCLPALL